MKNIIRMTLVAAGLGIGAGAFAQADVPTGPPPSPPAGGQSLSRAPWHGRWRASPGQALRRNWLRRLAYRLQLNQSQRAQLRHIHAKVMAGIWAARADQQLTAEQRGERIQAAAEGGRDEFRGMLTPDQRAKLEKIESHREATTMGL